MTAAPLDVDSHVLIETPGPASGTGWPERIALSVGIALFVGVALWAMWRAWQRFGDVPEAVDPLPRAPADLGDALAGPFEGCYLATTTADGERLVVQGLALVGAALLAVTDAGVYIERTGAPGVFLPSAALRGGRLGSGAPGSVQGPGGFVAVTWTHRRQTLDTAFRADLPRRHAEVVDAVDRLLARQPAGPTDPRTPEVAP